MDFQWPWTADFGRRVGAREGNTFIIIQQQIGDGRVGRQGRAGAIVRATSFRGIFLILPSACQKSVFMWESAEGGREKSSMRVMGDG